MVRNLHEIDRELAFRGDFISNLKRISARSLKNTVFPSKNIVWRSKTMIFEKNALCEKIGAFFVAFSRSSRARAGPIWAHKGPYGLIWALMGP